MIVWRWISAFVLAGAATVGAAKTAPKPELMVLGVAHFANPGEDIANTHVEDVLAPERQRQILAVVDRLAAFRPTHVMIEWPASKQAALDKRYADYRAGRFTLSRFEGEQIGFRLAARLGLTRVDAVDWNDNPPGQDQDYDFPAWLEKHGRAAEWTDFQKISQAEADADATYDRCHVVADWIRALATPERLKAMARPYFTIAQFGDNMSNPGAAWVGSWYARNLRIFNNVRAAGGAPGDRTVMIFGAGHAPLLRDFAAQSGTFAVVEPARFLPPPGPSLCRGTGAH